MVIYRRLKTSVALIGAGARRGMQFIMRRADRKWYAHYARVLSQGNVMSVAFYHQAQNCVKGLLLLFMLMFVQWDPKGAPASVGLRKQLRYIDTRRV